MTSTGAFAGFEAKGGGDVVEAVGEHFFVFLGKLLPEVSELDGSGPWGFREWFRGVLLLSGMSVAPLAYLRRSRQSSGATCR